MGFIDTIKKLFGFSSGGALKPGDRMLECEDCHQQFVFDAGEQVFFKEKGFTDPKRCPRCRKKVRFRIRRRGGRGRGKGGHESNHQDNQHNSHGGGNRHRGGNRFGRRHSVIDGDSPYADER